MQARRPTPNVQRPIVDLLNSWLLAIGNWQSHDLWRTRMALGIVARSAFGCTLCACGASRAQAPAGVRFRALAATACRNRESAAAHYKIWSPVAWTFPGHYQSGATASALHVSGCKASRARLTHGRRNITQTA